MKTKDLPFGRLIKRRKRTASLLAFIMTTGLLLTGMTQSNENSSADITVDGETVTIRACGERLEEVLRREGIILGEYDRMNYSADERVKAGMSVVIDRVEYIGRTTSESIPYETVYIDSTLDAIGTSRVKTEDREGRIDTTVTEKIVNGEIVYTYISITNETAPVAEEIVVGTAHSEPYSRREGGFTLENGLPTEYAYCLEGKVTAYTAPEGSGTYSGRPLEVGTVGVDPDVIPFGSEVYVCSKDGSHVYGCAIAADTGCLTDVIADVYMGTTRENLADACEWGAQDAYVFVLTVGDNSVLW